jgi:sec-independent protein translocase protein TatA
MLALLLFGAGKLADVGGALGKSIREFRHAASEADEPPKTKTATESAARACPNCGATATQADRFCRECGTKLDPEGAA